ncbi:thiamineS protein [Denitrovibrio acetiphilus DSM 12809]|jgi:sulfur carrier protein|uniref:ThiamineS protein n=1 Tax=Denitrovibrio acetiphilus (strain DSM 12809 / NBRC 114555 / N2460) TaxID=522772 RepID=D4H8T3_DENA2|nr:MoaD/ThiS family protein [Denitrovibrio acetiphilus]ADD68432.1 thiamineS protein [Denitrovibrio acetiphilus DSM 12809]
MIIVNMPDGKVKECKRRRVKDILKELGLNENAVLVAKGDELLTPDITIDDGDEIRIISVVSGG